MNPWERFFNAHAGRYMDEPFTSGTAGDWGRRPIRLDEYEIMVVARRPEDGELRRG